MLKFHKCVFPTQIVCFPGYSDDFVETTEDREDFTINPPDVLMIDDFGEAFEQAVSIISQ